VLFSKSGFTERLADELGDHWSLFGLKEMDRLLE